MPKTVLFTFENDTSRDEFLSKLKSTSSEVVLKALNTIKLDPPVKADFERSATLFVSGKKLAEGSLSDMQKRFGQEIAAHSASVEVRELREGTWTVIKSRKSQK